MILRRVDRICYLSDSNSFSSLSFLFLSGVKGARWKEETYTGGYWGQWRYRGCYWCQEQSGWRKNEETERPLISFIKTWFMLSVLLKSFWRRERNLQQSPSDQDVRIMSKTCTTNSILIPLSMCWSIITAEYFLQCWCQDYFCSTLISCSRHE